MPPHPRPFLYGPHPENSRVDRLRGSLTHRVIGQLATTSRTRAIDPLRDPDALIAAEVARLPLSRLQADGIRATAPGHVRVYLTHFLPPVDWALAALELQLRVGVVDVAWATPLGTVWDEIKVSGRRLRRGSGPALRQVQRYAIAGRSLPHFAGVRLLFLGAWRRSLLISASGRTTDLVKTPYWFGPAELRNEATDS